MRDYESTSCDDPDHDAETGILPLLDWDHSTSFADNSRSFPRILINFFDGKGIPWDVSIISSSKPFDLDVKSGSRNYLTKFSALRDRGSCKNVAKSAALGEVCGLRVLYSL